jgi:hypothetical protein
MGCLRSFLLRLRMDGSIHVIAVCDHEHRHLLISNNKKRNMERDIPTPCFDLTIQQEN